MSEEKKPNFAFTSSLIGKADRSLLKERMNEPTGEAESLYGKIDPKEFGMKAVRETAPKRPQRATPKEISKPKYSDVLEATRDLDIKYIPKTRETRATFELLLSLVSKVTDDLPHDALQNACDEVIVVLKEEVKDAAKQENLEQLLGVKIEDDVFAQMISLSKLLTDYSLEEADEEMEDVPVAVVFDDQESEEEFVVKDSSDSESEVDESAKEFGLDVHSIDSHWIQKQLSSYMEAMEAQSTAETVFEILSASTTLRECENQLVQLLDLDKLQLIKLFLKHRFEIVFCTKLSRTQTEKEKLEIEDEMMKHDNLLIILKKLKSGESLKLSKVESAVLHQIDIDSLKFEKGSHTMTNKKCSLPEKSWKQMKNGYEEIHIPAPKKPKFTEKLIPVSTLPDWAQSCFPGTKTFNPVQSKLFNAAFTSSENLLLCAPTGAGKTNVAMLTILNEVSKHFHDEKLKLNDFKIVYVAPMKALVQEVVGNFSRRLAPLGISVNELKF